MFRIRAVTPPAETEDRPRLAGGLLVVVGARLPFVLDLTYWSIADHERQWQAGTRRLVQGAPSSALLTAYRGPGEAEHASWALWPSSGYATPDPQWRVDLAPSLASALGIRWPRVLD